MTGWVLDFSEGDQINKEPLHIAGVGTGLGNNIKSAQTLANPDIDHIDFWKT